MDTYAITALKNAARESVTIPLHDGDREDDPLRRLIEGDGQASALAIDLTEQITGKRITRDAYQNTAPACRAQLRRWAAKTEKEHAR